MSEQQPVNTSSLSNMSFWGNHWNHWSLFFFFLHFSPQKTESASFSRELAINTKTTSRFSCGWLFFNTSAVHVQNPLSARRSGNVSGLTIQSEACWIVDRLIGTPGYIKHVYYTEPQQPIRETIPSSWRCCQAMKRLTLPDRDIKTSPPAPDGDEKPAEAPHSSRRILPSACLC